MISKAKKYVAVLLLFVCVCMIFVTDANPTKILENVFDLDGDFMDENTVAVNIRRLREKIEDNPAAPVYIKNIRGLGYIWNQEVSQ